MSLVRYRYKIRKDGYSITGSVEAESTAQAQQKAFHQHACAGNSIIMSDIKILESGSFGLILGTRKIKNAGRFSPNVAALLGLAPLSFVLYFLGGQPASVRERRGGPSWLSIRRR